jgi:hypothetical protein
MEDKDYLVKMAVTNMLNRSVRIFKYNGLPDTIPQKDLELILQVNGNATWARDKDDKLYVFAAGLGGEPNPYYLPTLAVVANPALRLSKTFTIDKDCVVMLNDTMYQGLMPMFSKYAHLLAEAELSLKYAIINARVPALVQADNDGTYESAVEFFKKIVEGKEYGIISSKEFFDGIKTQDYYRQAYIKDLIESIQYIKGSWYSEIGLNAAFNMKREAINEAEASLNEDVLYPTIDTMLECRKIALDKINAMFGTNITVELDSIWKFNREHDELSMDVQKAELEQNEEKDGEDIETDRNTD